ncbi:MAG: hypothetical protein J3R72DRAFT_520880 [Linnemannia gamsii]|nr:MAG: hypothetical protein J3R72DRAFT_520880 [Linnemannia gamsii]
MSTRHQRFRQGDTEELLAVRKDKTTGELYSLVIDIQETFPDALRFKVNGVVLNYLVDKDEQRYEPKRVAHFPDDVIDITVSGLVLASASPPVSPSSMKMAQTNSTTSRHSPSADQVDKLVSDLSLQSYSSANAISIARPMVALSAIASDITHIQHQLDRSTDQQSTYHHQLLEQLVQLLQEQAEAKERDERVLAELAAAKERDEEMHRMQRQTIGQLIVAQHRIEAILVQNYELHEYPIPRLFVILPDSYERWDPRNILAERFRLYFLCECGDHCRTDPGTTTSSGQLTITAASPATPIPVKNSIHLAKHEGYELSRPTEFFDSYGPYVLGMLRILKHCLAVATVVAPALALADNTVKDVMDGVKSISESTMKAIDMSIDFLEQRLDGDALADGMTSEDAGPQEEEDMFSGLAALEGADLRRLESFLRNKDADKILGNLYRITTDTGHVKWVCLDHYRQVYRETAMSSFLQCVESNGGTFDPQVGKVTVSLKSTNAAKDFFSGLTQHAPAIIALDVTLNWSYGTADVTMVVDKVAESNVQDLNVRFQRLGTLTNLGLSMRLGEGRYRSLLDLFSITKIKKLSITDANLLGLHASKLLNRPSPSLLQSFHFQSVIRPHSDPQLADIILHCPHLVDLKLGECSYTSAAAPKIDQAIGSLSKLEVLHRFHLYEGDGAEPTEIKRDAVPYGSVALRELVDFGLPYPTGSNGLLESAIRRSLDTLEVLMLRSKVGSAVKVDFTNILGSLSPVASDRPLPFAKLTHLKLSVRLTKTSFVLMASILPRLRLSSLDLAGRACRLAAHANLSTLKSIYLVGPEEDAVDAFSLAVSRSSSNHVDSLYLAWTHITTKLLDLLAVLSLKRFYLINRQGDSPATILQSLNLSQLQMLFINDSEYNWEVEEVLAGRGAEFVDRFVLQLPCKNKASMRDIHKEDARDLKGSSTRLARHCVRVLDNTTYDVGAI